MWYMPSAINDDAFCILNITSVEEVIFSKDPHTLEWTTKVSVALSGGGSFAEIVEIFKKLSSAEAFAKAFIRKFESYGQRPGVLPGFVWDVESLLEVERAIADKQADNLSE